jgi:hypothetical protein
MGMQHTARALSRETSALLSCTPRECDARVVGMKPLACPGRRMTFQITAPAKAGVQQNLGIGYSDVSVRVYPAYLQLPRFFIPPVGKSQKLPLPLYLFCCLGHAAKLCGLLLAHDDYRLLHDKYPLAADRYAATKTSQQSTGVTRMK